MKYLESIRCVHRDLAARNVLVASLELVCFYVIRRDDEVPSVLQ